jgi:hypothetical protein
MGLNPEKLAEALDLLDEAVEYGVEYRSDAELYEALGMTPPSEGDLL